MKGNVEDKENPGYQPGGPDEQPEDSEGIPSWIIWVAAGIGTILVVVLILWACGVFSTAKSTELVSHGLPGQSDGGNPHPGQASSNGDSSDQPPAQSVSQPGQSGVMKAVSFIVSGGALIAAIYTGWNWWGARDSAAFDDDEDVIYQPGADAVDSPASATNPPGASSLPQSGKVDDGVGNGWGWSEASWSWRVSYIVGGVYLLDLPFRIKKEKTWRRALTKWVDWPLQRVAAVCHFITGRKTNSEQQKNESGLYAFVNWPFDRVADVCDFLTGEGSKKSDKKDSSKKSKRSGKSKSKGGSTSTGMIIFIVVLSLLAVAIVSFLVWYCCQEQSADAAAPQYNHPLIDPSPLELGKPDHQLSAFKRSRRRSRSRH